jgi:hypothetical protein
MKLQLWLCVLQETARASFLHSYQLTGFAVHLSQTQNHCCKVTQITKIDREENQELVSTVFHYMFTIETNVSNNVKALNRTDVLYHAIIFFLMSVIFLEIS